MNDLPEKFIENMKKQLPEDEWEAFFAVYARPPHKGLRVNVLKISAAEFEKISPFPLRPVPWEENGFYTDGEKTGAHAYHFAGLYYSQEPSAMCAAPLLAAKSGERILDLCSAPGGKGTQLAAAMKGEGILVLNEPVFSRAQILSRNVERLGVKNAVVLSEYPETLAEYFPEYFDKILVDAPCSGEGMFRKNAEEALSEWSEENVAMCAARQKEILDYAFRMLKAGGKLVYSTCTFSEAEDEEQTENFLSSHAEMRLLAQKKLYPHKEAGEGHFAALFEKGGREEYADEESHFALLFEKGAQERTDGKNHCSTLFEKEVREEYAKGEDTIGRGCFQGGGKSGDGARVQRYSSAVAGARPPRTLVPRVSKTAEKAYREFERDFFFRPFAEMLHEAGNFLYSLPKGCFDFGKLNVLRAGVRLGEMKNGRFEPSHSLAMCVARKECRNVVSIPSDDLRADKFLRGETVDAEECKNGWCIVCIDGYPVGLGKAVNGTIKNHIPKGLRKLS